MLMFDDVLLWVDLSDILYITIVRPTYTSSVIHNIRIRCFALRKPIPAISKRFKAEALWVGNLLSPASALRSVVELIGTMLS